jgi:hypothetical protein
MNCYICGQEIPDDVDVMDPMYPICVDCLNSMFICMENATKEEFDKGVEKIISDFLNKYA